MQFATIIAISKSTNANIEKTILDVELEKYSEVSGTEEVSNGIHVTFESGRVYLIDTDGDITEYIPPITIANKRKESEDNGVVSALSNTETTIVEDDYSNDVPVPKGFGIATDSGTKVEEGIVIEDADNTRSTYGSQFVWVPVGTGIKVSEEINVNRIVDISIGRYLFNVNTGASSTYSGNYTEDTASSHNSSYSNTIPKDLDGFLSSVNTYGGYYISRYEAGITGTTANSGLKTKTKTDGTIKPQSKLGLGVWNCISQTDAANVCRNMYSSTNDGVTSDLINSYAWDTALLFIQECRK